MKIKKSKWLSLLAAPISAVNKKIAPKISLVLFRRELFFIASFISHLPAFFVCIFIWVYLYFNPVHTANELLSVALLASKTIPAFGVLMSAWFNGRHLRLKHEMHKAIRINRRKKSPATV